MIANYLVAIGLRQPAGCTHRVGRAAGYLIGQQEKSAFAAVFLFEFQVLEFA